MNNFVSEQAAPKKKYGKSVWEEITTDMEESHTVIGGIIQDMKDRDDVGKAKYGMPLERGNGRDHLVDAYQESLDLLVYLRAANEHTLVRPVLDLVFEIKKKILEKKGERYENFINDF